MVIQIAIIVLAFVLLVIGYELITHKILWRFRNSLLVAIGLTSLGVGALFGLFAFVLSFLDPKFQFSSMLQRLSFSGEVGLVFCVVTIVVTLIPLYMRSQNRNPPE